MWLGNDHKYIWKYKSVQIIYKLGNRACFKTRGIQHEKRIVASLEHFRIRGITTESYDHTWIMNFCSSCIIQTLSGLQLTISIESKTSVKALIFLSPSFKFMNLFSKMPIASLTEYFCNKYSTVNWALDTILLAWAVCFTKSSFLFSFFLFC